MEKQLIISLIILYLLLFKILNFNFLKKFNKYLSHQSLPDNIILFYYTPGCSWCKRMRDIVNEFNSENNSTKIIEIGIIKHDDKYNNVINKSKLNNINNLNEVINIIGKMSISVKVFPTIVNNKEIKIGCFKDLNEFKIFNNN